MGTLLHQFRADQPSCKYIFKNGQAAIFSDFMFRTDQQYQIDELMADMKAGLKAIWIPTEAEGGATVDSDDIDPQAVMERKIIAKYLAEQARANNNGTVNVEQVKLNVAGSNLAGVNAATSNSGTATAVPVGSIKAAK